MKYISDLHFIYTPSSLHINIRLADPLSPLLSELSPYLEKGQDSYYFFDRYVLKDWYAMYKYLYKYLIVPPKDTHIKQGITANLLTS